MHQPTDQSHESVVKDLSNKFAPHVLLIKHEKKFQVDNTCANLAIKYNMIYISVYQLIKEHITKKTKWGCQLIDSKRERDLNADMKVRDDFEEFIYSPVHYDENLVKEIINKTVSEKRTNQKFVILEGLCNSNNLAAEDDKMVFRFMDELFAIEHVIGEVKGIISLQSDTEPNFLREEDIEYEVFPEPEPEVEKPKKYDEDGNEIVDEGEDGDAAAEEENPDEPKVPKFKPEDYKWTVSNRKPFNLPMLYQKCKGVNTYHDVKESSEFGSTTQGAIAKCLDTFCGRLLDSENNDKYIYQQIVFK